MRALLLAMLVVVACQSTPSAPVKVDAGPPPDPLAPLRAAAEKTQAAGDWRTYADALAKAGRRSEALSAYEMCAQAATDLETSLYCQAAAAVAKKVHSKPATQ